jgi:hypothetical protein
MPRYEVISDNHKFIVEADFYGDPAGDGHIRFFKDEEIVATFMPYTLIGIIKLKEDEDGKAQNQDQPEPTEQPTPIPA